MKKIEDCIDINTRSSQNIELDYEKKVEQKEVLDKFYQKLDELKQEFTPSEWHLIATEFGLEGYGLSSDEEVAKIFNCTSEQINDNRKKLVKKLQSPECKKIMSGLKF